MLTIIDKNRSYIHLETETGVQFIHFLSLRAFDKNLNGYNENYCWSGFCKGARFAPRPRRPRANPR